MILFNTNHLKVYNYIIHHFLEVEIFNGDKDIDIGDKLEIILPKYLFREQYQKCEKKSLRNYLDGQKTSFTTA